jgi:geranylgeranyl diphosphate synthase, type II
LYTNSTELNAINTYLAYWCDKKLGSAEISEPLAKSIKYSLLGPGKRFRPLLVIQAGLELGADLEILLPYAAAVEMIHTYSLIHDDLPSMDNDDLRRGRATNHKIFGDDFALLAGDALLTEAFALIASAYEAQPAIGLKLSSLLSEAAGVLGMVNGQALDIKAQQDKGVGIEKLRQIHRDKTGALIRVSIEGAAVIADLDSGKRSQLRKVGELLGFAFQLADDIHDFTEDEIEHCSYTALLGLKGTRDLLEDTSSECIEVLKNSGLMMSSVTALVNFNRSRTS